MKHTHRSKSKIATTLAMLFGVFAGVARSAVPDPVADFLSKYETIPGDEILKLEADINGDGNKEVFLSLSKSNSYKSGHLWVTYIGVPGGFMEAKGIKPDGGVLEQTTVSFRPDVYYVGQITELNEPGILAFIPGDKSTGTLKSITIVGDKVKEKNVSVIAPQGSGKSTYDHYFGQAPTIQIQKISLP